LPTTEKLESNSLRIGSTFLDDENVSSSNHSTGKKKSIPSGSNLCARSALERNSGNKKKTSTMGGREKKYFWRQRGSFPSSLS
jgi:hypothetical protein